MLIHSYIYYHLHTTVITDEEWQRLANELKYIQKDHPEPIGWYDYEFVDWNGDTGMHLPRDPWTMNKAEYIIKLHKKQLNKEK